MVTKQKMQFLVYFCNLSNTIVLLLCHLYSYVNAGCYCFLSSIWKWAFCDIPRKTTICHRGGLNSNEAKLLRPYVVDLRAEYTCDWKYIVYESHIERVPMVACCKRC